MNHDRDGNLADSGRALARHSGPEAGAPGGGLVDGVMSLLQRAREADPDMTVSQLLVLLCIASHEETTGRAIAQELALEESSVSRTIGLLGQHARGTKLALRMIETREASDDRRYKVSKLSARGKRFLAVAFHDLSAVFNRRGA